MKKVILLILLLFFAIANASEYSYFCSSNTAKRTFSGVISSTFGINLLSRNAVEKIIENTIKKETNAKFKVKINNFYSTNFLNGEFKNLSAKAKKYEYDGFYLSNINVQTICPYNSISFVDEKLYFRENMVLKFSAQASKDELKKTLNSGKLNKKLAKILTKVSKNEIFIALANSILPLSFPIEIDKNNKGQLKITQIHLLNGLLTFESYILISKNL